MNKQSVVQIPKIVRPATARQLEALKPTQFPIPPDATPGEKPTLMGASFYERDHASLADLWRGCAASNKSQALRLIVAFTAANSEAFYAFAEAQISNQLD